jgi:hypothetical protein
MDFLVPNGRKIVTNKQTHEEEIIKVNYPCDEYPYRGQDWSHFKSMPNGNTLSIFSTSSEPEKMEYIKCKTI